MAGSNINEINRRSFVSFLGGAAASFCLASSAWARQSAAAAGKPNFIIIFTDDQGYQDLGVYNSPLIKTPNIDRMAQEGMKFTDFYVAAPVCSPSRAALMTGCYPRRVGWPIGGWQVFAPNMNDKKGLNPDEITIAELMKCAGYTTGCVGKWHLGHYEPFYPTNQGFDSYYGVPYSNDMSPKVVLRDSQVVIDPYDNNQLVQLYTKEALAFIDAHKSEPFFLYLAHNFPHTPLGASEDFKGTSARGAYGDAVEEIDWSTGQVLQKLRDLGLDKNTFVIFTSDNGPWYEKKLDGGCAHPLRCGKGTTHDGGMREPCIMWWPETIPANTTCSELATAMDIYPTLAAIAGISVPQDRIIDGKNILPLILNQPGATSPHEAFLYYHHNGSLDAIRKGKWKYCFQERGCTDPHTAITYEKKQNTLYDLSTDPGETDDCAAQNASVVEELKALALSMDTEIKANRRPIGNVDMNNWSGDPVQCPQATYSHYKPGRLYRTRARKHAAQEELYNLSGRRVDYNSMRKLKKAGVYLTRSTMEAKAGLRLEAGGLRRE
jgi:arylsulfatase A-like enzyme